MIIQWSKTVFLINCVGRTELVYAKKEKRKKKLDDQFTPYSRINSKWMKDLNISYDTINILVENLGSKIPDIPCSNNSNDISPRAK